MTMSAVTAEYRIRVATAGAAAVTSGTVALTLDQADITEAPTLSGPSVSALDAETVSAPFVLRVITDSVLFTSSGRFTFLGRLAEIQRRIDGGVWTTVATGRLSHATEIERGLVEVEVSDERWVERNARLFETTTSVQLHPPGVVAQFMSRPPSDGGSRTYVVRETSGNAVHLVPKDELDGPDIIQVPKQLREVLARDLIAAADQESSASVSGGNFTNLRFDLDSGGPTPGDYTVISFRPNFSAVYLGRVDRLGLLGTLAPDESGNLQDAWIYIASHGLSANDEIVGRFYWPSGAPVSDKVPVLIGGEDGVHPGDLLEDVLDGTYGGDAVGYDATAMTTLKALPLRPVWVRATEPINRADFTRGIYRTYGIAPLVGTDLQIYPTQLRIPQNLSTGSLTTLDATNASRLTWQHGGRDLVTRLEIKARALVEIDRTSLRPADWPVDEFEQRVLTHGVVEHDNTATLGEITRSVDSELILEPWPRSYDDQSVQEIAQGIFEVFGDGAVYGSITVGDNVNVQVGDCVILDCASLQAWNANTADRTGERLVMLLTFTEMTPASVTFEFLDLGPNAAVLSAPTINVTQNGTDPALIDVVVSGLGAGETAHVEVDIGSTTPTIYRYVREGVGNGTVQFRVEGYSGLTAYARAYTVDGNRIRSAWTTDTVVLATEPLFDSTDLYISKFIGVVSWDPGTNCAGVRTRYSSHARGEIPSFGSTTDYDATDLGFNIAAIGYGDILTVGLTPYTGFSSGAVSGTAGDEVFVSANNPLVGGSIVQDTLSLSGQTKTIRIPAQAFQVKNAVAGTNVDYRDGYVTPVGTTTRDFAAPLVLPEGATITQVRWRTRHTNSADQIVAALYEADDDPSAAVTTVASDTVTGVTGLQYADTGTVSQVVAADKVYVLHASMNNNTSTGDIRLAYAEVSYTIPSVQDQL